MSNYLNSLVARQLDSESPVQPRLSSLFEPPASAPAPRPLVAVDSRAADAPIASIEPVASINLLTIESIAEHAVAVPAEAVNPLEPTSGSPSSFFSLSSDETPGTVWRGRQTMDSIASLPPELTSEKPAEGERQARGPQSQMAGVSLETTKTTPLSPVTTETPPLLWRNSHEPLSALPEIERERNADPQANSARLIQTTINETAIAEGKRGVESNKDPRIVRPRVGLPNENPRAGNNSVMPVALPAAEPAPVINVTIGRIEVRATIPATSARKQPSAKPLMSLDEYLQRRTRGGST
jgi:hypothetical protein